MSVLGWMFGRDRNQAARVYTWLEERHFPGERTRYLNLGWWAGARTFDDACDALAEQLGLAACMSEGDEVLDVGFGFGDQDAYWLQRFRPARIVGLNVTPLHVAAARDRFPDPRLDFRLGSATSMELPASSVDCVTALECAFHFVTREDFFREALRVLRPGGRLGTADVLPAPGRHGLRAKLFAWASQAFWQMPRENWYGIDTYRAKLEALGFVDVEVRSVRQRVLVPFWEAVRAHMLDPSWSGRWNRAYRWVGRLPTRPWLDALDYVMVSARRPRVQGQGAAARE